MEKAGTFNGKIQVNHYDAEGLRHEIEENDKLAKGSYSNYIFVTHYKWSYRRIRDNNSRFFQNKSRNH